MLLNSNMDAGNNSEPPKHTARHEAVPGLPHTPRPTHATPASFGWHSFIFGSLSWLSAHCSDLDPKLLGLRTLTYFSLSVGLSRRPLRSSYTNLWSAERKSWFVLVYDVERTLGSPKRWIELHLLVLIGRTMKLGEKCQNFWRGGTFPLLC